jgi:hypothetical protein
MSGYLAMLFYIQMLEIGSEGGNGKNNGTMNEKAAAQKIMSDLKALA